MYIGKSYDELWACFPMHNLSASLSNPKDLFWNTECLADVFNSIIDAVTISEAVKLLEEKMLIF